MLALAFAGPRPDAPVQAQMTRLNGSQTRILTNLQTGTSYTLRASDCGKLLSFSNAAPIIVTLPPAGNEISAGCWMDIQNTGAGAAYLTAAESLLDGVPSLTLATNQGLRLVSDGITYFTQRGQGVTGAGSSTLSVLSEGSPVGASSTMNLVAGTGVACIPQVANGVMTIQCNADTSYLASKLALQSGDTNPQICTSSSSSGTDYTAACASTLNSYSPRQTLFWYTDVANTSTTPTLDLDTLGPQPLVRQDGTALASGDIKALVLYRIWYDGANLRVVEAGLGGAGAGALTTGGSTSTRGLFNTRGSCTAGQNGNIFFATDIPHQSQCDGSSWADYIYGQPVTLPAATAFNTLNGAGYTVTTNGISTISGPSTSSTNVVGQEIAVPAAPWTIVAWMPPVQGQGIVNLSASAGRILYVRDAANHMVGLYEYSKAYNSSHTEWTHWASPVSPNNMVYNLVTDATVQPFLRIHYDGTTFTFSGCTTYNAATSHGDDNYGGGNCEEYYHEAANAYLGTLAAVGWGLDTHTDSAGKVALTLLSWQVTN